MVEVLQTATKHEMQKREIMTANSKSFNHFLERDEVGNVGGCHSYIQTCIFEVYERAIMDLIGILLLFKAKVKSVK